MISHASLYELCQNRSFYLEPGHIHSDTSRTNLNLRDLERYINDLNTARFDDMEDKWWNGKNILHFAAAPYIDNPEERIEVHANVHAIHWLLINTSINVNESGSNGMTPLHDLCKRANSPLTQTERGMEILNHALNAFLEGGADINALDNNGQTPLDLAYNVEFHALLEERGARKVDSARFKEICQRGIVNLTTLGEFEREHLARGDIPYLEKCRKELNTQDRAGRTLLHFAVSPYAERTELNCKVSHPVAANPEVLRWLLNNSYIDVNARGGYKSETPLHALCGRSNLSTSQLTFKECIEILLDYGADIHAIDKTGNTPLDWTINQELRRFLEAKGALAGANRHFVPQGISTERVNRHS